MSMLSFPNRIHPDVENQGFSVTLPQEITKSSEFELHWSSFRESWDDLPEDRYLKNGAVGTRQRRYGRFSYCSSTGSLEPLPHTSYFQAADVNRLVGGIRREFAPLTEDFLAHPLLRDVILESFAMFPVEAEGLAGETWNVDVHVIRILAQPAGGSSPTPEGIHQDGLTFITTHLIARHNVDGGTSIVFSDDGAPLKCVTLSEPFETIFIDDRRMKHAVTPIAPVKEEDVAYRDTLLLGFDVAGRR